MSSTSWKHYLLEQAIRHYVQNVDEVLNKISIPSLMFGSLRMDEVHLVPAAMQDALFSYIFYACEIVRVTAFDIQVSVDWLRTSTKSVTLRARSLELDIVLHDPNGPVQDAARGFWDAQRLRHKAEQESLSTPADSSLLYKVLGGLDITADAVSVRFRSPEVEAPRLQVAITGLRYGPATPEGEPTLELDVAMRPNLPLCEWGYSYRLDISSLILSVLPIEGESWRAGPHVVLEGLELASHGRAPASRRRQAPFYVASALEVHIRELGVPGGVPLEALVALVQVLSLASASDALRGTGGDAQAEGSLDATDAADASAGAEKAEGGGPGAGDDGCDPGSPKRASNADRGSGGGDPSETEASRETQERLLAGRQTTRDMADWLAGAARSKRDASTDLADGSPGAPSSRGASPAISERAPEIEADDDDDFQDCEEFDLLELPPPKNQAKTAASEAATTAGEATELPTLRDLRGQRGLSRSSFFVGHVKLEVRVEKGTVAGELSDFAYSSDKRKQLSKQQMDCLQALFDLPEALQSPTGADAKGPGIVVGTIYAGLSLASACVSFTPKGPGMDAETVLRLDRGLKLRHRGEADVLSPGQAATAPGASSTTTSAGAPTTASLTTSDAEAASPMRLLDVEAVGVQLRDTWREEVQAVGSALSDAVAPSPVEPPEPPPEKPRAEAEEPPICYNLEVTDFSVETDAAGKPLRCVLPCVRARTIIADVLDVWNHSLWDLGPLTRRVGEPLGGGPAALPVTTPLENPWWERPDASPCLKELPRKPGASSGVGDIISELERRLESERRAKEQEQERATELEAKLHDVLRAMKDWTPDASPAPQVPAPVAVASSHAAKAPPRRSVSAAAAASDGAAAAGVAAPRAGGGRGAGDDAAGGGSEAAAAAPPEERPTQVHVAPPTTYDLDVGEERSYRIEGLQRGDAVQWLLEEMEGRTVDVTAILRSRCKLHRARLLRETERTGRCGGALQVSRADFSDEQLPLTLEIHVSNSFSWWTGKRVSLWISKVSNVLDFGDAARSRKDQGPQGERVLR